MRTVEFATELGTNPRTLTYWAWTLKREASGQEADLLNQDSEAAATRKAPVSRTAGVASEPSDDGTEADLVEQLELLGFAPRVNGRILRSFETRVTRAESRASREPSPAG